MSKKKGLSDTEKKHRRKSKEVTWKNRISTVIPKKVLLVKNYSRGKMNGVNQQSPQHPKNKKKVSFIRKSKNSKRDLQKQSESKPSLQGKPFKHHPPSFHPKFNVYGRI